MVMSPTPADVEIKAINYESSDDRQFDGFEITAEGEGSGDRETGMLLLHGLRGFAVGAGITPVAYPMARAGVPCLAINKRNSGKYFETSDFDEVDRDIAGAIDWLVEQGCDQVVLFGRSIAATEVAYYQGKHNDDRVCAVVLAAPFADLRERTTTNYFEAVSDDPQAAYEEFVDRARALVDAGRENEYLLLPRPAEPKNEYIPMSAATFLSYRGPDSNCATIKWTPNIEKPLLLLAHSPARNVGPEDACEIEEGARRSVHVETHSFDTDHVFSGKGAEMAETIQSFLQSIES